MVSENLEQVKANIEAACKRCASCCCQQDKADFFN